MVRRTECKVWRAVVEQMRELSFGSQRQICMVKGHVYERCGVEGL